MERLGFLAIKYSRFKFGGKAIIIDVLPDSFLIWVFPAAFNEPNLTNPNSIKSRLIKLLFFIIFPFPVVIFL